MNTEMLLNSKIISSPWCITTSAKDDQALFMNQFLGDSNECEIIRIDAINCRTLSEFYSEIYTAFNFPKDSGLNLNALLDRLGDYRSSGINPFGLIFYNSDSLLVAEKTDVFHGVISTFNSVGQEWAEEIDKKDDWYSPVRKFLVVLVYD